MMESTTDLTKSLPMVFLLMDKDFSKKKLNKILLKPKSIKLIITIKKSKTIVNISLLLFMVKLVIV